MTLSDISDDDGQELSEIDMKAVFRRWVIGWQQIELAPHAGRLGVDDPMTNVCDRVAERSRQHASIQPCMTQQPRMSQAGSKGFEVLLLIILVISGDGQQAPDTKAYRRQTSYQILERRALRCKDEFFTLLHGYVPSNFT